MTRARQPGRVYSIAGLAAVGWGGPDRVRDAYREMGRGAAHFPGLGPRV